MSTAIVADIPDEDSPLSAGEGLGLFVLTGALWFFLGPELQGRGVGGFIASQVVLLLGPTLLFSRLKNTDVRAIIGWRRPAPGTMAGALLIGASAWAVSFGVGLAQEAISPVPPELAEAMRRQLEGMGKSPVMLLIAVSLVPAVCEEILCRGMLARALRGTLGIVAAAAVAAVLFALLHQSMYRFFPQLVLGLSLGLVTLRARSVIPAIVIHLMHNGILLGLAYLGLTIDPPLAIPAALIVYAAGHVIALRKTSP
jgi:membrane protease YdiL (CAAX protease family)